MSDTMTPKQRHECMSHIRSKNTRPEVALRRALFALGYRYRLNVRTLPGSPDIVLPKYRTVIFVNGCFWHGHNGCRLYTVPSTNRDFWVEKVRRNRERDEIDFRRLEALAWNVIIVWECQLKPRVLASTLDRVVGDIQNNGRIWVQYNDKRRSDRIFARAEAARRKAVREEMERELHEQFDIPERIVRFSRLDTE